MSGGKCSSFLDRWKWVSELVIFYLFFLNTEEKCSHLLTAPALWHRPTLGSHPVLLDLVYDLSASLAALPFVHFPLRWDSPHGSRGRDRGDVDFFNSPDHGDSRGSKQIQEPPPPTVQAWRPRRQPQSQPECEFARATCDRPAW